MVISHLDMINIQKQMLSAGQWILWWKASAQWKVSFWFCVSLSKTLPWFDTAYQRPLGWAEWQCNLWTCTDSASQTVLRPSREKQGFFGAGSHNEYKMWWGQCDPRGMYFRELHSSVVRACGQKTGQHISGYESCPHLHILLFSSICKNGIAKATDKWKNKEGSKRGDEPMRSCVRGYFT